MYYGGAFFCAIFAILQMLTGTQLMTISTAILSILLALWLGAMVPGPSFVLVARSAIGRSRVDGLATALGMGAGALFFGCIALGGLYTLLQTVEWLYISLKVIGGGYLILIGVRMWHSARRPFTVSDALTSETRSVGRSFGAGLVTQLSNPKTAIYYGSIFAALLPQHPPLLCYFVLPPLVFLVEAGWYVVVALCFSSHGPREIYLRRKMWVDRIAAGAISALGLRLIVNASKAGI